jgi:phosphoserine phosphatase
VSSTQLLVVLDVDSTLTQDEGIDLLARRVSPEVADRVAGITTRAMNGELDFAQSLIERVETLQGVTLEQVAHATSQVRLSVGAQLLIDTLHAHGHLVAAVSGGFHEMLDPLAASVGLDMHHANRFVTKNGVLTGKVAGPIVDASSKAATLRRWADEHGIAEHNTVAVGDGGNDVEMLVAAGMGISYMGKPVTKKAADRCIDVPDLSLVLQELGISRA